MKNLQICYRNLFLIKKFLTIDDIDTEIIAMHYGIVWGKDKEYSHKTSH